MAVMWRFGTRPIYLRLHSEGGIAIQQILYDVEIAETKSTRAENSRLKIGQGR